MTAFFGVLVRKKSKKKKNIYVFINCYDVSILNLHCTFHISNIFALYILYLHDIYLDYTSTAININI